MSDTSPINSYLSSSSYNSPKRLNSEEVESPFPNPNNPVSQPHSSQYAKEDSSSANPSPHLIPQTFFCPHNLMMACSCCSQQLKQRVENLPMKGFEKLLQSSLEKAQVLEGSLGNFKEEVKKLQKRVKDITDPIKNTVQSWFEMSVRILVAIRNKVLEDLDQEQQEYFSNERFKSEIAGMENQIMVLKRGLGNAEELQNEHSKEASFQFGIQKKMQVIQKLSNSLIDPDVSDLKKRLNEIILIDDQAIKRIRTPAFVDVLLYQRIDIDASTMASSFSWSSRS